MKTHNRVKFHFDIICGCQVINFQMFSWQCSIHELGHLREILSPNSPKYCLILLKFAPEVVLKEEKTMFQKFLENSNRNENWTLAKFFFFFFFEFSLNLGPNLPNEGDRNRKN